jgi:drug/metabolite transporter (DMT)-like permease
VAAALAAGLLTTAYNLIDAHGIRQSDDPLAFTGVFFILEAIGMRMIAGLWQAKQRTMSRRDLGGGLFGGIITFICYASALLAYHFQNTTVVAGLRETSVLFALLIARHWLREPVDRRDLVGRAAHRLRRHAADRLQEF